MDVHIIPGVKAHDVAEAHRKDMLIQGDHECKCMTYWIDEERENVFCLIEAPDKEAVENMHHRAHGLIPNRIIEVSSDVVQSFLGRIYDPENAAVTADGLKVFHDPSYRVLLVISMSDPVLLQNQLGREQAAALIRSRNERVRHHLHQFGGREAEYDSHWFVASFTSAAKAMACARAIVPDMPQVQPSNTDLRIAIHGGEPVSQSDELFGATLRLARNMCGLSITKPIAITSAVKELLSHDHIQDEAIHFLNPQDEQFLDMLFDTLAARWQDPGFSIPEFCRALAVSKSQLYRKTIELTGHSPNDLLKNYRLDRAKEMMRKKRVPVSQATFDSGFTSPSYFTKCFKKKFEILPLGYLEMLG
jgi:AraC-like DNA-binding protein